jgi:hypothetical protein
MIFLFARRIEGRVLFVRVNRHPLLFPDWTHANAIIYSDDGNLLISMRHQNWVIKVDYGNGVGTGNILWRLGQQGDFVLNGGTDPTDWFYAQHAPSFTTTNTSGKFSLVLFDNGDDRVFAPGQPCQPKQLRPPPWPFTIRRRNILILGATPKCFLTETWNLMNATAPI